MSGRGLSGLSDPSVRARDDAALYRCHHDRLRCLAVRIVRDEATAEDVASETLARGWSRRAEFADDDAFSAWTYRVARNLAIDHMRRRKRFVSLDAIGDRSDDTIDITAPLEREEEHRFVRAAFASLTDRHREALYLREIEGVEYEELARVIGTSPDSARQVVTRARKGLRRMIELVAEGTLGTILWVRVRVRHATERVAHVGVGFGRAIEAALALGIAGSLAVLPAAAVPGRLDAALEVRAPGHGNAIVGARPGDARGEDPHARRALIARIERSGEGEVRARVPLGPAGEQEVWARAWREGEQTPSRVLTVLDEGTDAACAQAATTCAQADRVLADPFGRGW